MPDRHTVEQARLRVIAIAAAVVGIAAVLFLGVSIARQVSALNQENYDRAQWSLSQTEIEFLEYSRLLSHAEPDVPAIRLRFDVFYSRVTTIAKADVFVPLRDDGDFAVELGAIQSFLEMAVPIIDAADDILLSNLDVLIAATQQTRQNVRRLSVTGLQLYTRTQDQQRREVRLTTTQLAAVVVALFAALVLTLLQMDRLNKRAAQRGRAVQQSNTRLNTIIGSALDGIVVTDADFKIVEFNPAAVDVFRCSAEDALGRDLLTFLDVTEPGAPPFPREAALAHLQSTRGRLKGTGYRPDQSYFPIEIAFERAATPSGDIQVAFIRDISRQEAAENELVAARDAALAGEKVKSDFLATMSHEIRTPLNGLMGNIDLLQDTQLSDMQNHYVQNMVTSGRMLMQHVSDVLDITQYDAGKLQAAPVTTHLPTLIEDVVTTQIALAEAKKIALSWHWIGAPLAWAKTDPDSLQLILMNLVSNAVKFTRKGQVVVSVEHSPSPEGDSLHIAVADTGPGIGPDHIDRIFDDFVTGDVSAARAVGGSGLGLGIARRFAEAVDGTIEVSSTLGEGSTFTLSLPIAIAAIPDVAQKQAAAAQLPPQRILLVEDNGINRTVAREMLEADGHRVTEAVDGQTGVALADATRFDLILMDISMPGMDGRQAAELIAGRDGASCESHIVALTANALTGGPRNFLQSGLSATITKPINRETLRQTLRSTASTHTYPGPLVAHTHLAETRDALGAEALSRMQDRFTEEVAQVLETVTKMPRTPLPEIAEIAHRTASSAVLFGAKRLQAALLDLERWALAGDGISVHHARRDLPGIWAETQTALRDGDTAGIAAS